MFYPCLPEPKGLWVRFVADGGHGAVAWNKGYVVIQGQQLVLDGLNQGVVIPLGEIGAADGAVEQYIAHDHQLGFRLIEHHMAGGVSRAVAYFEAGFPHGDAVTLFQPAVGGERA